MIERHGLLQRRTCGLVMVSRTIMQFTTQPNDHNGPLRQRLKTLAEKYRRYGHIRLHVLIIREGLIVNHKRINVYIEKKVYLSGHTAHWVIKRLKNF